MSSAELAKGEHPIRLRIADCGIKKEPKTKTRGGKRIRNPHSPFHNRNSQDRDLETRTGTVTRTVPTLSESFRQIVIGLVDLNRLRNVECGIRIICGSGRF